MKQKVSEITRSNKRKCFGEEVLNRERMNILSIALLLRVAIPIDTRFSSSTLPSQKLSIVYDRKLEKSCKRPLLIAIGRTIVCGWKDLTRRQWPLHRRAARTGGCEREVLVVAKTEWWREEEGRNLPRKRSQESGGISGRTGETTLAVAAVRSRRSSRRDGERGREREAA